MKNFLIAFKIFLILFAVIYFCGAYYFLTFDFKQFETSYRGFNIGLPSALFVLLWMIGICFDSYPDNSKKNN